MLLMTLQCILTNLNNPDLNPRYVQIQLWISLHVCEFHYMVMNIINILHSLNHLSSLNKFINPNTSISIGTGLFGLVRMHCSAPVYSIIISDLSLCVFRDEKQQEQLWEISINMIKEFMTPEVLQQYGPALPVSSQEEQQEGSQSNEQRTSEQEPSGEQEAETGQEQEQLPA